MRVLVTGGRNWTDETAIYDALKELVEVAQRFGGEKIVVVHGGARGADMGAGIAAIRLGLDTETHPIIDEDWEQKGLAAGPIRNRKMLDTLDPKRDVVIAFPTKESKGTWDTVEEARRRKIHVIIHAEPGSK